MKNVPIKYFIVFILFLCSSYMTARAAVYIWRDEKNVAHCTTKPPPPEIKKVEKISPSITDSQDADSRYSDWTETVDGLQIRFRVPSRIIAPAYPPRNNKEKAWIDATVYLDIEVKNVGQVACNINKDFHVWSIDSNGARERISTLSDDELFTLKPGSTTKLTHESHLSNSGDYYIQVEYDTMRSQKLPCHVEIMKTHFNPQAKAQALQALEYQFPSIQVNTLTSNVKFSHLIINRKVANVDGWIYTGVIFEMPRGREDLVLSYHVKQEGIIACEVLPLYNQVYINPKRTVRKLKRSVDNVGKKGDVLIFMDYPGACLRDGDKYILCFTMAHDLPVDLTCSINRFDLSPSSSKTNEPPYKEYFKGIFDASE